MKAVLRTVLVGCLLLGGIAFADQKESHSQDEPITVLLQNYVAESMGVETTSVTLRILSSMLGVPSHPTGSVSHVGGGIPVGRVTFLVDSAKIVAHVEVMKDVVVAHHTLRRNQVIQAGDLMVSPVRIGLSDDRYFERPDLAIGQRVMRSVPARFPLTEDLVGAPFTIRQGARLTIQYDINSLIITAVGLAKEDGAVGANIRVTNLDSKKDLVAKVIDSNTVRVGP